MWLPFWYTVGVISPGVAMRLKLWCMTPSYTFQPSGTESKLDVRYLALTDSEHRRTAARLCPHMAVWCHHTQSDLITTLAAEMCMEALRGVSGGNSIRAVDRWKMCWVWGYGIGEKYWVRWCALSIWWVKNGAFGMKMLAVNTGERSREMDGNFCWMGEQLEGKTGDSLDVADPRGRVGAYGKLQVA